MIILKRLKLKLDRYLEERQMTRYVLAQKTGIKYQTIDGYYKNSVLRYDVDNLSKIITALDCGVEDLFEIVEEADP
ncbi:helix-turn-helix transcriptional regulator [uncultured Intestinimonas sp.]|uniref:helix-turn-helix domain-containing protein n=1 Tax=uncultured Intestinimonas sp. TaxID=1689265 RepID=UPI0025E16C83|nr:helix-turn-helix transcriptional regulator [uncultured Intestinimonas sp.]